MKSDYQIPSNQLIEHLSLSKLSYSLPQTVVITFLIANEVKSVTFKLVIIAELLLNIFNKMCD